MKVRRFHPLTGAPRWLDIPGLTEEGYHWWLAGAPLSEALSDVSPEHREAFISGLLPEERKEMIFGPDGPRVSPVAPVGGTPAAQRLAA